MAIPKKKRAHRRVKPIKPPGPSAYELYRQALEAPPAPNVGNHSSAIQYGTKKSPELCAVFLTWLSKGYVPAVAAEKIGISRGTAFRWKSEDEEFAKAWDEAVETGVDLLEQAIRDRSVHGVDRPVFQGGMFVGMVREYSDSLAAMMLQGRRPMYRKQQPDDSNNSGVTININGGLPGVIVASGSLAKKDEPSSS